MADDERRARTPFDVDAPRVLLYALAGAVLIALVVAASTSTAAFGAYNPAWDGASELQTTAEAVGSTATIGRETATYGATPPTATVALVLSPEGQYTDEQTADIRRFVRAGGTLVVAEDIERGGNDLLNVIGATARFNGTLLRDDRFTYRSSAFPIATNVSESRWTRDVNQLTLNHGTVIEPGDATVIARSSPYSYLDYDGDAELDANETLRARPVVAVEQLGAGRVIIVSDPSLFINAMLDRPGNRQFTRTLFAAGDHVLLDYSHTASIPPLSLALLVLRQTAWLQAALGLLGIGVVAAWSRGLFDTVAARLWGEQTPATPRASADDLAAYLQRQHPDWDEDRIERVVEAVQNRRDGS